MNAPAQEPKLDNLAGIQGRWSQTANKRKASYEGARKLCFVLSIVAALLAALASQLPDFDSARPDEGQLRLILSVASGGLLSIVALITARLLSAQKTQDWIQSRAVSEGFKRIAYTYAAQAAPYDNPASRDVNFDSAVATVTNSMNGLAVDPQANEPGRTPMNFYSTADEYLQSRPKKQSAWYRTAAAACAARATLLRRTEFILAVVCAVITAGIGVWGKTTVANIPFDFVALTGVLTTLSGAILAYLEASRADFLARSYVATADALDTAVAALARNVAYPSPEWSAFVEKIENILATENTAWLAKMGATT